jgi:ribonuclease III
MKRIKSLESKINIIFKDKDLLLTALTHPSFINENDIDRDSYQRLEFFGDAVLEFLASRHLYESFKNIREGRLTEIRAALVRTETLSICAKKIRLGEYLFLSKGEESNNGRNNPNILADTLESLLGAIYFDQGIRAAEAFFNNFIQDELETIIEKKLYIDTKTRYQEIIQSKYKITPEYKVINEHTSNNETTFTVAVFIKSKKIAIGKGKNKKIAEQAAATNALGKINKL